MQQHEYFSTIAWSGMARFYDEYFKFYKNCIPKWFYHFMFPPVVYESSSCSLSLSTFGILSLSILAVFNRNEVVSHHGLVLHFLGANNVEYLFTCLLLICITSAKENLAGKKYK